MNKKEQKSGIGFYIALCCCVAVIGLIGYIGRYAADKEESIEPTENVSVNLSPTATPVPTAAPTAAPVKTAAPLLSTSAPKKAMQTSAKIEEPTPSPIPSPSAPSFIKPCDGSVIKEMSGDELEYNNILGDWRTHNGIDISSSGEIKAVHSGTVTEIFTGALGETVIMDCQNGFTVVYGCLSGTDSLTVGQEIKAGDILATAGGTGSENVTEPHVHIEIIKDGSHVNPLDYINFEV